MTVNSPKIEGLLGMLTIRLNDDNFVKWSFQFQSVLQGYDLFDHFDGSSVCPPKFVIDTELGVTTEVTDAYKSWIQTDKALLSLLLATLSDDAIEYVVGSKTSAEAWTHLQDRYATVSRARVNHLKTEFHTMHKGADSIEKYLLRIKTARDQLVAAGERITDDDVVITALNGLPQDYDMIRTVLLARDSTIGLKDLRAQLLNAERQVEIRMHALSPSHLDIMVLDFIPTSRVLPLLFSSNPGVHLLVLSLMLSQNVKYVVRGVTLLPIVFIAILLIQTLLLLFSVRFVVKKAMVLLIATIELILHFKANQHQLLSRL